MTLKTKLFLAYQGIAVITLLVLSFSFSDFLFKDKMATYQDQMSDRMTLVNYMIRHVNFGGSTELPPEIKEFFSESHWIEMGVFSLDPSKLIFKTAKFPIAELADIRPLGLATSLESGTTPESLQIDNATKNIWGYSVVKAQNMVVVGYVPSGNIYRVLYFFAIKIVAIGLLSMGLISIFAKIFSTRITNYLSYLNSKIAEFGAGNLQARIAIIKGDELGAIAKIFNKMAGQIGLILNTQKEQARLEHQISNAQRIQEFFLPHAKYVSEKIHIQGFHEAAERCGGDWWFYHKTASRVYFFIGDVSGHGTASAMITSSCRSVVANIFHNHLAPPPSLILEQLNSAIYQTVRGDLNMTMCVFSYCQETATLEYANASHEMPLYWSVGNLALARNDLKFFVDIHGSRLGEAATSTYRQSTVKIEESLRILLYSDGLTEMSIPPDVLLGERRLSNIIISAQGALKNESTCEHFFNRFNRSLTEKRGAVPLVDDLSYLIVDILV